MDLVNTWSYFIVFSSRSEIRGSLNKYHQHWHTLNLCCRFWHAGQWMNLFIPRHSSLMSLFTILHSLIHRLLNWINLETHIRTCLCFTSTFDHQILIYHLNIVISLLGLQSSHHSSFSSEQRSLLLQDYNEFILTSWFCPKLVFL